MTSKLMERLINKEYLTERERKEWLGIVKKRLEQLEQLEQEEDTLCEQAGKLFYENLKLKNAIEIIKNKRVNFDIFMNCLNLEEYNNAIEYTYISYSENYILTQQEYELIKEVLCE